MPTEFSKNQISGVENRVFDHCFLESKNRFNPIVEFLSQLHTNLMFAKTDAEKIFISDYVDKYINIGLDRQIPGIQNATGSQEYLQDIHDYAMSVRREAFPEYDSGFLEKYIDIMDATLFGFLKSKPLFITRRIKNNLQRIKAVLDAPEKVGLADDFGFQTCRQESLYLLSQIEELSIRHNFFTQKWFPTIKNEMLDCLDCW